MPFQLLSVVILAFGFAYFLFLILRKAQFPKVAWIIQLELLPSSEVFWVGI